jgi:hypothetical protein
MSPQDQKRIQSIVLGCVRSMIYNAPKEVKDSYYYNAPKLLNDRGREMVNSAGKVLLNLIDQDNVSIYNFLRQDFSRDPITQEIKNIFNTQEIKTRENEQLFGAQHQKIYEKKTKEDQIIRQKEKEAADAKAKEDKEKEIIKKKQEVSDLIHFTASNDTVKKLITGIDITQDFPGRSASDALLQMRNNGEITESQFNFASNVLAKTVAGSQSPNLVTKEIKTVGKKGVFGIGNTLHDVTIYTPQVLRIQQKIKELTDQNAALEIPDKNTEAEIIALTFLSKHPVQEK